MIIEPTLRYLKIPVYMRVTGEALLTETTRADPEKLDIKAGHFLYNLYIVVWLNKIVQLMTIYSQFSM